MSMTYALMNIGTWLDNRGVNILDTGAPFYEVYDTSDDQFVAVGAIEPQFYRTLLERLDLDDEDPQEQWDRTRWPLMKERFASIFRTKTRDEWTERFVGVDACVTPVLSPREAPRHSYNAERNVFSTDGALQPQPAPRFSKTPGAIRQPPRAAGSGTRDGLSGWGVDDARQATLREAGAFG